MQENSMRATIRLRNAPHTATELAGDWQHPYSREQAAFPLPWVREAKVWPAVKRIDNAGGDRNLICTCPPISEYADQADQADQVGQVDQVDQAGQVDHLAHAS